jgi:hypothetical protein
MPEKNKQVKIMLLIAFFTIVVALFFVLDLQKYLTLEYLKSSKAFFISSYENNPILVLGSYFLFYIVITAFSLPGAVWMTLGGGAFFRIICRNSDRFFRQFHWCDFSHVNFPFFASGLGAKPF